MAKLETEEELKALARQQETFRNHPSNADSAPGLQLAPPEDRDLARDAPNP